MNEFSLIYPMFALFLLTAFVLGTLLRTRLGLLREGQLSVGYFQTYQGNEEPDASLILSRHFSNLRESPTLYYVACLAAMVTHQATPAFHALAWTYVAARMVHTVVHTGRNKVANRASVYFLSWFVLIAMWLYLTVGIAVAES